MPSKTFKLYTLKDVDYDAVIAKYRELCESGIREITDDGITFDKISEPQYIVKKEPRKPLMDDTRIRNKAIFLLHTIIYRQQTSRENNEDGAALQASVLQAVLKNDCFELLTALVELGYIERTSYYIIGKTSRRYRAIGETATEQCSNATIQKYISHSKRLLNDMITARLSSAAFVKEYGEGFAERYALNLNRFHIKDEKGFEEFASQRIKNNPDTEAYYDFVRDTFKSKLKIYKIDDNNRIYHILTSLKRELKQYVNIRYSIDCSNSHPLLFNYFIFISKKVSISTAYTISSILSSISPSILAEPSNNLQYDIQYLRNKLINNGVRKSDIAKLEDDELLYLWKTTTGTFWDDILAEHQNEGYDRAEIKVKMFGEVFYSKTPKIAWKSFAKEFKSQYPNVYELILRWKEPQYYDDIKAVLLRRNKALKLGERVIIVGEASTALPRVMMELESVIFKEILTTLFRKRICAVHIHDAIIIPEVKSTEKLDAARIQEVMRETYKRFGLHPTFKVEFY